jgi:crotonobetainyl-CoA:carnitine CoA-transferase CaiB-like acyl-CoA transferase
MLCGTHLAQGLLAALVRRQRHGLGAHVEVSLMESLLDFQFEALTTYLNDGQKTPQRSEITNAHSYLGAPYGIYATVDGYVAIAMGNLDQLSRLIECPALAAFAHPEQAFRDRDKIKKILAAHLSQQTTSHWLDLLEPADYWCSDVFTYAQLLNHAAYRVLEMQQTVTRTEGVDVTTTRCPIRFDGQRLGSKVAAPHLGNANATVSQELGSA